MTHKMGAKGQVVIPKELRDQLGLKPADEVEFWREGDHIAVRRRGEYRPLQGRFRGSDLTSQLEMERRADQQHEENA